MMNIEFHNALKQNKIYPLISKGAGYLRIISLYPACFLILLFSCAEQPVDENYFSDESRILGGEIPGTPALTPSTACWIDDSGVYAVGITIADTVNPVVNGLHYDQDGQQLTYLFYSSANDPAGFSSVSEYYNEQNYCCWTGTDGNKTLYSSSTALIWIWITAYDGGRESVHSNAVPVSGMCTP